MNIDALLTPYFSEKEKQFDDRAIIMIDVLRASTTVCSALFNGAKEVIPSESHEKAVSVYSSLSRETRFLGGEKKGIKPEGFDAGNSPSEYTEDKVKSKTVILATTNGTKIFTKAKQATVRIVGGFVNISSVLKFVLDNHSDSDITIICAGTDGRLSYEDVLCAGAYISKLCESAEKDELTLTDTAHATMDLYKLHSGNMSSFLRTREHSVFLDKIGFADDIETALSFDIFPVIPIISGSSIKQNVADIQK